MATNDWLEAMERHPEVVAHVEASKARVRADLLLVSVEYQTEWLAHWVLNTETMREAAERNEQNSASALHAAEELVRALTLRLERERAELAVCRLIEADAYVMTKRESGPFPYMAKIKTSEG